MEIYEVGPGAALSGMVKRITKGITAKALNSRAALEEAAAAKPGEMIHDSVRFYS